MQIRGLFAMALILGNANTSFRTNKVTRQGRNMHIQHAGSLASFFKASSLLINLKDIMAIILWLSNFVMRSSVILKVKLICQWAICWEFLTVNAL